MWGPPGLEEEKWRRSGGEVEAGQATGAQEACWVPRWGPQPSETRGRRHAWAPSVPMSLSPTPTPPRAFSSLVGLKHRPHPQPKPHPCLGPALHSQGLFHLFFFFFFSSFLLLWFCFTFWLLFHLYFYFYILSNISVSFLV